MIVVDVFNVACWSAVCYIIGYTADQQAMEHHQSLHEIDVIVLTYLCSEVTEHHQTAHETDVIVLTYLCSDIHDDYYKTPKYTKASSP